VIDNVKPLGEVDSNVGAPDAELLGTSTDAEDAISKRSHEPFFLYKK